jgi:hypothetical protein
VRAGALGILLLTAPAMRLRGAAGFLSLRIAGRHDDSSMSSPGVRRQGAGPPQSLTLRADAGDGT